MEKKLQQTAGVADNLPTCDLAVIREPDLIWDILFGQLSFCLANKRDFGNGINAIGEQVWSRGGRLVKSMTGSQAPLLHGNRSQTGETDHVTSRVDMRHCRLI